ncbi:MAG: YciI family protein [Acidimicrobiia bacterium]
MGLYMALIYSPADYEETGELRREVMAEYVHFEREAALAGVLKAGHELAAVDAAVTIRSKGGRGGMRILSDGPFAETKEVLGGYFLLECDSRDEAIAWASRIPAAWRGAVEVRPIVDGGE